MKLLVDGIALQNAHQRGIQRYCVEVLSRMVKRYSISVMHELPLQVALPEGCRDLGSDLRRYPRKWHVMALAKRAMLKRLRAMGAPKYDLFMSTHYSRSPHAGVPSVVVVHDMIHERLVHTLGDAELAIETKRLAIMDARVCIAISEATATDLRAIYPEISDRVRVIHHGCDHLLAAAGRAQGKLLPAQVVAASPYILFVGSRYGYKNFLTLLDAMTLRTWPRSPGGQPVKLVVVGAAFSAGERLLIRRMGLTDRILHAGSVPDDDLASWYQGSLGFIFPSLVEGFGFPTVEAQSLNTPVLCSDIPVFREVCGDAALYFNPLDPQSIVDRLSELLSPEVRDTLRRKGGANIHRFTWDRCAELTMKACEDAATGSLSLTPGSTECQYA